MLICRRQATASSGNPVRFPIGACNKTIEGDVHEGDDIAHDAKFSFLLPRPVLFNLIKLCAVKPIKALTRAPTTYVPTYSETYFEHNNSSLLPRHQQN